ncbi:hypothetical protein J3U87_10110 [Sulfidibacter corallicola]|uniref:Uncharacterized protein n=1 Tax=Sulfidibacter corallicola TaxID=2818388 RepID=A0A8A4TS67_SULCO|nr:hypothetical protein [Sulfidibacter corallicola]QTD52819.1 hypothetical protein J3U87_10110 [Sulfidibacter corallicola]
MTLATVTVSAIGRVFGGNVDQVLVDMVAVNEVKVTVVKVIYVVVMFYSYMPAVGAVGVVMAFVNLTFGHRCPPLNVMNGK